MSTSRGPDELLWIVIALCLLVAFLTAVGDLVSHRPSVTVVCPDGSSTTLHGPGRITC